MAEEVRLGELAARDVDLDVDRRAIGERILGGEFAPGNLLPNEAEWGAVYGASRTAVREAIKALLDDAQATGELKPCDTRHLAGSIYAIAYGAIHIRAVSTDPLDVWVSSCVREVLDPWRA